MSTINLLPSDYIESRCRHRTNVMCLALGVIVITAVAAAGVVSERSSSHTQAVRDRVNAAYADAAKLISQMQLLEVQRTQMLRKAQVTSSLVERVPRSTLLAVLTNALPKNCSLVNLDLDTRHVITAAKPLTKAKAGSKLTSASRQSIKNQTSRVEIQITGRATTDVDVARFIANLLGSPLMSSVDLVYSEEKLIDKVPVREFQIRLELKANADAIDVLNRPGPEDAETSEQARANTTIPGSQT